MSRKEQKAGNLIPYVVDDDPSDKKAQANIILKFIRDCLNVKGDSQIGILCPTSERQTQTILNTYKQNEWKTTISGSIQAEVMSELENIINTKAFDLRYAVRIIPITVMRYDEKGYPQPASIQSIIKSINDAARFIKKGGVILAGLDSTFAESHEYVSDNDLTKNISDKNKILTRIHIKFFNQKLNAMRKNPEKNNIVTLQDLSLLIASEYRAHSTGAWLGGVFGGGPSDGSQKWAKFLVDFSENQATIAQLNELESMQPGLSLREIMQQFNLVDIKTGLVKSTDFYKEINRNYISETRSTASRSTVPSYSAGC